MSYVHMLLLSTTLPLLALPITALPIGLIQDAASHRIHIEVIGAKGSANSFELASSRRGLLKLKHNLGPSALAELLKPDLESANAAWHSIVDNSDPEHHILAEAHITAVPDSCSPHVNFTANSFLDWFARGEPENEDKILAAYPEHYGSSGSLNDDGSLRTDSLESWGPLITHSSFPRYAEVGTLNMTKKPWMDDLPDYPRQFVAEAILLDGSGLPFSDAHYSFKDVVDGEGNACGLEAKLALWLPSAAPEEVVEGLKQHQAIEFSNWLASAYRDIQTGKFLPGKELISQDPEDL